MMQWVQQEAVHSIATIIIIFMIIRGIIAITWLIKLMNVLVNYRSAGSNDNHVNNNDNDNKPSSHGNNKSGDEPTSATKNKKSLGSHDTDVKVTAYARLV
jgi:hypothetical protein